jgi:hypothetical protein
VVPDVIPITYAISGPAAELVPGTGIATGPAVVIIAGCISAGPVAAGILVVATGVSAPSAVLPVRCIVRFPFASSVAAFIASGALVPARAAVVFIRISADTARVAAGFIIPAPDTGTPAEILGTGGVDAPPFHAGLSSLALVPAFPAIAAVTGGISAGSGTAGHPRAAVVPAGAAVISISLEIEAISVADLPLAVMADAFVPGTGSPEVTNVSAGTTILGRGEVHTVT